MIDEVINEDLGADHPHETPHFKPNGGCDCICDDCLVIVGGEVPMADYACICPNCSGQCGSTHAMEGDDR